MFLRTVAPISILLFSVAFIAIFFFWPTPKDTLARPLSPLSVSDLDDELPPQWNGIFVLDAVIGSQGRVTMVRIEKPKTFYGFDEASFQEAATQTLSEKWRFEPATSGGRPVESTIKVLVGRPGPGATLPKNIRRPWNATLFPKGCLSSAPSGMADLSILVLENGSVGDAVMSKSSGISCIDEGILENAADFKFIPAMLDDKPVAVWITSHMKLGENRIAAISQ